MMNLRLLQQNLDNEKKMLKKYQKLESKWRQKWIQNNDLMKLELLTQLTINEKEKLNNSMI